LVRAVPMVSAGSEKKWVDLDATRWVVLCCVLLRRWCDLRAVRGAHCALARSALAAR